MATFADFYNSQYQGSTGPSVPKPVDFSSGIKASQISGAEGPADPWKPVKTVLDILGRPVNAVIGHAENSADRAVDFVQQAQSGDLAGAAKSASSAILGIDREGGSAAGKALVSTDEKYRRFGSDFLESTTDRMGTAFDPEYVDREDNVNPVVKGVAGFAIDVVADPLTWIPGGLVLKGLKAGGGAIKAGAGNAKEILRGERAATLAGKEADEVAPAAVTAAKAEDDVLDMVEGFQQPTAPAATVDAAPVPRTVVDDLLDGPNPAQTLQDSVTLSSWKNVSRETPDVARAAEDAVPTPRADVPTPGVGAGTTPPSPTPEIPAAPVAQAVPEQTLQEAFANHPRRQVILDEIDRIRSAVGEGGAPPKFQSWFKEVASQPVKGDWASLGFGKKPTYAQVMRKFETSKATNPQQAQALHRFLVDSHRTAADSAGTTISDARQAFQLRAIRDEDTLIETFGPKLFDTLSQKNSAASFARSFDAVSKALDPTQNLARFTEKNADVINALRGAMHIPAHIKPRPATAEEIRAAGRTMDDNPVVREAISKVAREADPLSAESFSRYPERNGLLGFTSKDPLDRDAKHLTVLGTFDQLTIYKSVMQSVKDSQKWLAGGTKTYGREAAKDFRTSLLAHLDSVSDVAMTLGTPIKLGVKGEELLPITHAEVLRSVEAAMPEGDALRVLYQLDSSVAPTPLLNAVHKSLTEGISEEDVVALLLDKKYGFKGARGEELPNWLNSGSTFHTQYAPNQGKAAQALAARLPGGKVTKTQGGALRVTYDGRTDAPMLAKAIVNATPGMARVVAANADALAARVTQEAAEISNEVVLAIKGAVDDGISNTDLAKAVHNVPEDAAEIGTNSAMTQESVALATTVAEGALGNPLVRMSDIATSTDRALLDRSVSQAAAVNAGSRKMTDAATDELMEGLEHADNLPKLMSKADDFDLPEEFADDLVEAASDAEGFGPLKDLGDDADILTQSTNRLLDPFRKLFSARFGQEQVFELHRRGQSAGNLLMHTTARGLGDLARKYTPASGGDDVLREAFSAIQRGDVPEHLQEAAGDLSGILDRFLATGEGKSYLDMPMLRADGDVTNLNDALETAFSSFVQKPNFDLDAARAAAGPGARSREVLDAMKDQWREWQIEDPLDFMSRFASATALVAERKATANSFMNKFEKLGFAGTSPFEGAVRITDLSGKSVIRRYFPDKYYVDKDLANELHRMDQVLRTSTQIDSKAIEKYMAVQNAWKRGMTIMRPGHHFRNFVGDSSITFMARGTYAFGRSMKDSVKVLGFRGNYEGVDVKRVLDTMYEGENILPSGGEVIARGRIGNRQVELNAESIRDAMMSRGLLATHRVAEDLYDDALSKGGLEKFLDKATLQDQNMGALSKVGNLAADTSMFTSHVGRGQHFIQYVHQALRGKQGLKGFKSLDDLFDKAADEVMRAHPDGSLLSTFERKYMRVIIPFYSWFAKTLPFAIESTMRHPGRFSMFPKASYNLAVSMGIDPNTLADPFPADQMFPEYLTEGFYGPQFKIGDRYINVNPGIAVTDLFADIGNDPVRGVAGMVSPLLRAPAELLSGSSWSTGAQINDTSDYIDSSTPGINNLANFTGYSPTGSLAGILTGQGPDQQYQVAQGNKEGFDSLLSSLNWLTGMQTQNWSRPNMINRAEIEARNAARGE